MQTLIHRDSKPWQLQVWVSFLIAVFLCAVGLSWLPGKDLDRAFMVMGYFFCLSAAFVLAKYVRDQEQSKAEGKLADTPMFKLVVWGGFFLAMSLTGWGLWCPVRSCWAWGSLRPPRCRRRGRRGWCRRGVWRRCRSRGRWRRTFRP